MAAGYNSESESACKAGYYACFKDCCQRINQFCNFNTQRCQACDTRSMYCGNDSLPRECDAWCLLQNCSSNTAHMECQCESSTYQWTTFILSFVLACVMFGIIVRLLRNWKGRHHSQDPNGTDAEVSTPLTESLEVLQERQEVPSDFREWSTTTDEKLDDSVPMTVKKERTSHVPEEKASNFGKEAKPHGSCRQLSSSGNTDVLHNVPPTSCDVHPILIHTGISRSDYSNLYKSQ